MRPSTRPSPPWDAQAEDADQKARMGKMRTAMADWRERIGDKVVALMADPARHAEAGDLSGVKSLTGIRAIQKDIREAALQTAQADQARARAGGADRQSVDGAGRADGPAGRRLMGWLLSKSIADPVSQMTGVMRGLASGGPLGRTARLGPPRRTGRHGRRRGQLPRRRHRETAAGGRSRPRSATPPPPSGRATRNGRARRPRNWRRWSPTSARGSRAWPRATCRSASTTCSPASTSN